MTDCATLCVLLFCYCDVLDEALNVRFLSAGDWMVTDRQETSLFSLLSGFVHRLWHLQMLLSSWLSDVCSWRLVTFQNSAYIFQSASPSVNKLWNILLPSASVLEKSETNGESAGSTGLMLYYYLYQWFDPSPNPTIQYAEAYLVSNK